MQINNTKYSYNIMFYMKSEGNQKIFIRNIYYKTCICTLSEGISIILRALETRKQDLD